MRVVGMAATMRLVNRGPDEAINRRISLLVLNKQAEAAILHENAESQSAPISAITQPEPQSRQPPRQPCVSGSSSHIATSQSEVIA